MYGPHAVGRNGRPAGVFPGEKRGRAAAAAPLRSARAGTGAVPDRVTADGHDC
ncbi:MAG TPA: hypothetical protein VKJ47_21030 [Candidatus Binatia bacterium]|nr:hypothetical protein [Candidatus Binatia bacterium]